MEVLDAIEVRHSIRKYTEEPVSDDDLMTMLRAATIAPNAGNRQGWHFIAVKNKDVLGRMKESIRAQTEELASLAEETGMKKEAREMRGRLPLMVFFATAPVTVAVCERQDPPDGMGQILLKKGLSDDEIERLRPSRMMQSIGAAVENLMLTAVSLGYGTCWMTGPLIAVKQLEGILDVKPPFRLVALIPIGRPAQTPSTRPRKPLPEVVTIIR